MVEDVGRKYAEIHSDLEKKFHEVDVYGKRDDIDAYNAAEKLLDSYAYFDKYFDLEKKSREVKVKRMYGQVKPGDYYSEEIVKEYKELKSKLKEEKMWTCQNTRHYPWTSASDHIKRLAARINEVEGKVFQQKKIVMQRQIF